MAHEEATYATFEGQPLRLSIFLPHESASQAPVLVYSADLRWFAAQGWPVISVDCALSTANRHLWDVTQGQIGYALGWGVANAPRYGADPTRLSVSGHSAGGNLAINAAYLSAAGRLRWLRENGQAP